ncbi:NAD(+)/NADH kinase [Neisseria animalis]|uniref:NAD kinase n=1 Tax=Neisseria animalis TaxID=492 RepID=A0A5P3MS59_NEIAN|nr:NAD(+)/NADH kinase [Neisseria animalis]QEY24368.1 NAD kinase [Neisseria animalis]ROW31722.1 NAD kinase [Neisseria animalis]VEE06892.1 inorganic polyphosphate/ATP-NAD kinase [Neisseria animalis]
MKSPFRNIGIVTRPNTPEIEHTAHKLIEFLRLEGFGIYLDVQSIEEQAVYPEDAACCQAASKAELGKYCDLVVVLGGDGTFLSVAREVAPRAVPMIGINQGHLGFLTQISHESMIEGLTPILGGKYLPEERALLEVSLVRNGEICDRSLALNDCVLSRGGAGQMIEFEVFINREFVYTQRSDGLIVSTPTGSTAYALAAGGPILQAGSRVFTLVPICPQSMTNRPIAVADSSEIEILVTKSGDARVHFDGQSFLDIHHLDRLVIRRYHNPLRVLHPTDYQYYRTLRQKLHWGEQLV